MADDNYALPQDAIPDFKDVPKPDRDTDYAEPDVWKPLEPRSQKTDDEDDDDDYDDADLSIQQRGQEFIDSAKRIAARDEARKRSGYVDVDLSAVKPIVEDSGPASLADQMKKLKTSSRPTSCAADGSQMYVDFDRAVEVPVQKPPPVIAPARPRPASDRPPSPPRNGPPPIAPRRNVYPSTDLDKQVAPALPERAPAPPVRRSKSSFRVQDFLHGTLTKDESDAILSSTPLGSFLIRMSTRKRQEGPNYVLSSHGCHSRDTAPYDLAHFPISAALGRQGWKFSIPSADPKVGFYGLDELVNYFSKPNHPKLVLKYPVPPRS